MGNNMNTSTTFAAARVTLLSIVAVLFVAACGSSGNSSETTTTTPDLQTGTIGILFTDAPTDEYSEINLNVTEAVLIGGDESKQVFFKGSEPIDLLDLTNFSEPVVFGKVQAGTYTKLRLYIDELELVPLDGGDSIYPKLPANGKIDLLQPDGFDVLPGRTLVMEIDMDANKSIKITKAGNSGKVNFRPVVKVKIVDGGLQHKLARLEGTVSGDPDDMTGSFTLCDIDSPTHCVMVATSSTTGIFDDAGLDTSFATLDDGDMVVAIGRYETDPEIVLNAAVLEIGGNAEQVKGNVVSNPADSRFLIVADDDGDLVVELQAGTKYFDAGGEISAAAIVLGVDVEVEGVKPPKADPEDPDLIRAALIFLEAEEDEQLSGLIIEPIVEADRSFGLTTASGDTCVRVNEDADILLVDEANSEVTMGTFADLAVDQSVDLFGMTAADSCFDANEVIVEVITATP
jgi:hypothetical protein